MPDHQTTAEPASGRTSVALVTGASAGLGREIARQLVLGRGMTVLATARRMDRLEALRDELPAGSVAILGGDLADPAFRDRLWTWALGQAGRVDLMRWAPGHFAREIGREGSSP